MNDLNIRYCRHYLWNTIAEAKGFFSKEVIASAKIGKLSRYANNQNFEFYLPKCEIFGRDIRMEMWADNAWHARAIGWEYLMAVVGAHDDTPRQVHSIDGPELSVTNPGLCKQTAVFLEESLGLEACKTCDHFLICCLETGASEEAIKQDWEDELHEKE